VTTKTVFLHVFNLYRNAFFVLVQENIYKIAQVVHAACWLQTRLPGVAASCPYKTSVEHVNRDASFKKFGDGLLTKVRTHFRTLTNVDQCYWATRCGSPQWCCCVFLFECVVPQLSSSMFAKYDELSEQWECSG
jgi:hypothetical protein